MQRWEGEDGIDTRQEKTHRNPATGNNKQIQVLYTTAVLQFALINNHFLPATAFYLILFTTSSSPALYLLQPLKFKTHFLTN